MSKNQNKPKKHVFDYDIDNLDREILNILSEDGRTPYTEIAKRLLVSPGTIHVRMRRLEDLGIAKKTVLEVDLQKIGYDLSAYLGVHLEHGFDYEHVVDDLKKVPEVAEAYYTTGGYGVFVKIYCMNTRHLYDVLNHKIQTIPGIQGTETLICLEESIKRHIKLV